MSTIQKKALSGQRAAVSRTKKALSTYHSDVRRADRDTSLYAAEREQAKAEAKAKVEAEIAAAKADFGAAMAADRAAHARFVDEPSGQDLERRRYWQMSAQADLAGLGGDEAAALIRNLIAQGATVQAAEYARVARPLMDSAEHRRLADATMPPEQRRAQAWTAAMDAFEEVTIKDGWLDEHTGNLLIQAGTVHPDERDGKPSAYDDRALDLLMDRAEATAVQALQSAAGEAPGE